MKILVTGGAGFIGSHVVDLLLEKSCSVRVLDSLEIQTHGPARARPDYLNPGCEFLLGDVREPATVRRALEGVDAVLHFAASVGIGQSRDWIAQSVSANAVGTAVLLDAVTRRQRRLTRMVVASSMTLYGEGLYGCESCGPVQPGLRAREQVSRGDWDVRCPNCGRQASPLPTSEAKRIAPATVYAVTKRSQEEQFLAIGAAYGIPAVALRYFNVYGPRQTLSNPYTGVAANFCCRMLGGKAPLVYEDGLQSRDFVHVHDVARASWLALIQPGIDSAIVNVGTGRSTSLRKLFSLLAGRLGYRGQPQYLMRSRAGDIRHCFADTSLARELLGFEALVSLERGVEDLCSWARSQSPQDRGSEAVGELEQNGLLSCSRP